MSNTQYIAPPTSRAKLRNVAEQIRLYSATNQIPFFPIVQIVEKALDLFAPEYTFHISDVQEMGNNHGLTFLKEKELHIREDVYYGALEGVGRDRFTIAHEFGHALLHTDGVLARKAPQKSTKPYLCPEWQANTFACELLIYHELLQNYNNATKVSESFGVSIKAANIALKHKTTA